MNNMDIVELDPQDLACWGLHCFCIGARQTPHRAIAADNNGRILYLARTGVTRDGLAAAGVPCLDSQVALLQMLGVLCVSANVLRTTFPSLGSKTMQLLRAQSSRRAAAIAGSLARATRAVGDLLAANGARAHHYAVLFGHGLDGLVWDKLRCQDELPSTGLSVEKPFWNGAFWAASPKRKGVAGTNEAVRGTGTLVTVWTDVCANQLREISSMWKLGAWTSAIPVVYCSSEDPLHRACDEVALVVAGELGALADDLHAKGFTDLTRAQLLLVAGHEFIWDVAQELCRLGHLLEPGALRSEAATHAELKALTYIRSPSRKTDDPMSALTAAR